MTMVSRDLTIHPAVVRQYLLGALDVEASEELEARLFSDSALVEQLYGELDVLVEQDTRDELQPSERAQLDRLRRTAIWQERVQLAESLRRIGAERSASVPMAAARTPTGDVEKIVSLMDVIRSRRGFSRLLTIAAVVLLVVGWPLWVFQMQNARSVREQLDREASAVSAALASAQTELQAAQRQTALLQSALDNQRTVSFALYTTTRGGSSGAQQLRLPSGATFADFELAVDPAAPPPPYDVEVISLQGRTVVFSQLQVAVADSGRGRAPTVRVPAALLTVGEYRLSVWVAGTRTRSAPLGEFGFAIR